MCSPGHALASVQPCAKLLPGTLLPPSSPPTTVFPLLPLPQVTPEEGEGYPVLIEMWFLFCLIWGVGGPLDEDGRRKFDAFMREMDTK